MVRQVHLRIPPEENDPISLGGHGILMWKGCLEPDGSVVCVLERQEGAHIAGSFEVCNGSKIVNRFAWL